MRKEWNQHLERNYLATTGRAYVNPFGDVPPRRQLKQAPGWQSALKHTLDWARDAAASVKEYLSLLESKDVTVTERNKKGDWSYHVTVKGKEKTVRDFYQRKDKQTGAVKSTRGMGLDYTPDVLDQYFRFKKSKNEERDEHPQPDNPDRTTEQMLAALSEFKKTQQKLSLLHQINHQNNDYEDEDSDKNTSKDDGLEL